MSGKRRQHHHFVPKVLQKSFCSYDNHIWFAERDSKGHFSAPEDRNIRSTFEIKNLYTVLDEDDAPSDEIEVNYYQVIEDYWDKVLSKVFRTFDEGRMPSFQGAALDQFRSMVWGMMKRTPEFMRDIDWRSKGEEAIRRILKEDDGSVSSRRRVVLEAKLQDRTKLVQYGRDIVVRGTLLKSDRVEKALKVFSLRWVRLERKYSFILSGLMAYRTGNGGANGLINPKVEIWFPISPKIAAILIRDPEGQVPLVVDDTCDHVRSINEYAVRNSKYVASHSKPLLTSLIQVGGTLK